MPWANGPVVVYHGTDNLAANSIRLNGLMAGYFVAKTDFGAGFYVTTVLHQAQQWANQRCRRTPGALSAEVLEYHVPRTTLAKLTHLAFATDGSDYYDLVAYCRAGGLNHGPRGSPYDVVYGPVSVWPQTLVLANCDQILFSDPTKLGVNFRMPAQSIRPRHPDKFF